MECVDSLKQGDIVLVKCKVEAVFTGGQMALVTTRDCNEGFDAYPDEIVGVIETNENVGWIRVRYEEDSDGEYTYLSKMPDDKQKVFILYFNDGVSMDVCERVNDYEIYTESGNDYAGLVKAWMPIPKNYIYIY